MPPAESVFEKSWKSNALPNHRSKKQTPASFNIDLHYAKLEIWQRWDFERFVRLAKFLNLTLEELASLACVSHNQLPSLERSNRLWKGPYKDHGCAMVLTMLEAHVCRAYTTDVVSDAFPNLDTLTHAQSPHP